MSTRGKSVKYKPLLLLACSAKKRDADEWAAIELYRGTLFRAGRQWAEENGYNILILSALYGWVSPEVVIKPYDKRRKMSDPPPDWRVVAGRSGFYLGGQAYFRTAPASFKPLVPRLPMGKMVQAAIALLENGKLEPTP